MLAIAPAFTAGLFPLCTFLVKYPVLARQPLEFYGRIA
jgi:hypothetical protein